VTTFDPAVNGRDPKIENENVELDVTLSLSRSTVLPSKAVDDEGGGITTLAG
jgi:hypothetical protein